MAEAPELREHKPHPVGALLARLQLGQHGREDWRLGGNEALEVKRIGGGHLISAARHSANWKILAGSSRKSRSRRRRRVMAITYGAAAQIMAIWLSFSDSSARRQAAKTMSRTAGLLTGSGWAGDGGSVEKAAAGSRLGLRFRQFVPVS